MRSKLLALLICGLLALVPLGLAQQNSDAGTVALVGTDGNIRLFDVAADDLTDLTDDAGETRRYRFPTWASDGQLAYFGTDVSDPETGYALGVFLWQPETNPKFVYSSQEEAYSYAHWAPGDCADGLCRDLALLYTARDGLATRLIRSAEEVTITEVSQGGPHYWDWSPDGQQMIWQRFGTQYEIYNAADDDIARNLETAPGDVTSPHWSPVDDRVLLGVAGADGTDLVIDDADGRETLIGGLPGPVAYSWSPDAAWVAYLERDVGFLNIIDPASGDERFIARDVLAFFWSPDGQRIAYLALHGAQPSPGALLERAQFDDALVFDWFVYDVANDTSQAGPVFVPSEDQLYFLSFFSQFSRSHRVWSPDSAQVVYSAVTGGIPVVFLFAADDPGAEPMPIAEGTFGVFSW